jgi:transposase InsO family protein
MTLGSMEDLSYYPGGESRPEPRAQRGHRMDGEDRRRPRTTVLVHSDQGSQYGRDDWACFCRDNNIEVRMSCRGEGWDNPVAESFSGSLKNDRIKEVHPQRGSVHESGSTPKRGSNSLTVSFQRRVRVCRLC